MAPFAIGMKLFKTIASELKGVDVQLESLDFAKIAGKDINSIKNAIFQLLSSDALEAVVFQCMERCLYDGQKITRQTFEPEQARGDYLPIAWEVIRFNLSPFFSGLSFPSSPKPDQTAPSPQ
jgi:hypothetical protein